MCNSILTTFVFKKHNSEMNVEDITTGEKPELFSHQIIYTF